MTAVLQEIVQILVAGISALAEGIGSGLNDMATALFLDGEKLSTFGGITAIFGGIGFAVGLTTLVTKWIMSLGARN